MFELYPRPEFMLVMLVGECGACNACDPLGVLEWLAEGGAKLLWLPLVAPVLRDSLPK